MSGFSSINPARRRAVSKCRRLDPVSCERSFSSGRREPVEPASLSEKRSSWNLSPVGDLFPGPVRRARSGGYAILTAGRARVPGHLRGAGELLAAKQTTWRSPPQLCGPARRLPRAVSRTRAPAHRATLRRRSRFRRLRRRIHDHPVSALQQSRGGHGTRERNRTRGRAGARVRKTVREIEEGRRRSWS